MKLKTRPQFSHADKTSFTVFDDAFDRPSYRVGHTSETGFNILVLRCIPVFEERYTRPRFHSDFNNTLLYAITTLIFAYPIFNFNA